MRYIDRKVEAAKPAYVHARRKLRQPRPLYAANSVSSLIANPGNPGKGTAVGVHASGVESVTSAPLSVKNAYDEKGGALAVQPYNSYGGGV